MALMVPLCTNLGRETDNLEEVVVILPDFSLALLEAFVSLVYSGRCLLQSVLSIPNMIKLMEILGFRKELLFDTQKGLKLSFEPVSTPCLTRNPVVLNDQPPQISSIDVVPTPRTSLMQVDYCSPKFSDECVSRGLTCTPLPKENIEESSGGDVGPSSSTPLNSVLNDKPLQISSNDVVPTPRPSSRQVDFGSPKLSGACDARGLASTPLVKENKESSAIRDAESSSIPPRYSCGSCDFTCQYFVDLLSHKKSNHPACKKKAYTKRILSAPVEEYTKSPRVKKSASLVERRSVKKNQPTEGLKAPGKLAKKVAQKKEKTAKLNAKNKDSKKNLHARSLGSSTLASNNLKLVGKKSIKRSPGKKATLEDPVKASKKEAVLKVNVRKKKRRNLKYSSADLSCPHCDFRTIFLKGLHYHMTVKHSL